MRTTGMFAIALSAAAQPQDWLRECRAMESETRSSRAGAKPGLLEAHA